MENIKTEKRGRGRPATVDALSKQERNKVYYNNFKSKNDVNKQVVCEVCNGKYTYYNKYKHQITVKHLAKMADAKIPEYTEIQEDFENSA